MVSTDIIRRDVAGGSLIEFHATKSHLNFWVFAKFHNHIYEGLRHAPSSLVYADATNLTAVARRDLRALAELCEANTHLILFDNKEDAIARNIARTDSEETEDGYVNQDVMTRMEEQFDQALELIPHEPYDTVTVISNYDVQERYESPATNDQGST